MESLRLIKAGGAIIEDPEACTALLKDFAAIQGPKVLVHGGGRSASALAARMGIPVKMVEGRRITDSAMLEVVTMVYGGLVNKNLVASLQALGVNAVGLAGADLNLILCDRRPVGEVDYGYVGDVRKVDVSLLSLLLDKGAVPVIAPLSHDGKGCLLNVNADTIAAEVAQALGAYYRVSLEYRFEKEGVLDSDGNLIPEIDSDSFISLKASGAVSGGMVPKIHNALEALGRGVGEVYIGKTLIH